MYQRISCINKNCKFALLRKNLEEHLKGNCKNISKCLGCCKQICKEEEDHYECIMQLNKELSEAKSKLKEAMNQLNLSSESELNNALRKAYTQEIYEVHYKRCPICSRAFAEDAIETHKERCSIRSENRPVFNSAAQRLRNFN
eukprot:TRINITY_DN10462_c0_g1_i4.p1 TRINITY_DN10462_c0_g1~~TRINITY_DN10462_c0_g1_i4.p1  ORF type:complete len:143 (-),score=28.21 TRINITY_DN10462_c0_g1_i4:95-523(-)